MKILFCASEAWPWAKSGGLADVAYALPKALSQSVDVTLMIPWYRFMHVALESLERLADVTLSFGGHAYAVTYYRQQKEGMEVLFVYSELLSERDYLYGPPGTAYEENDLRFALFSRAIVAFAQSARYDILHLNDWHTALAALFARERGLSAKTLFTIHNLAFQGVFARNRLELLGIDSEYFHMEALEFYGRINFMKAGIAFADAVTTVSPTYAKEILTPEFGCGLEGFLRKHRAKLRGIRNGIDTDVFDPEHDKMLACRLKRSLRRFKVCNRKPLQIAENTLPLFIFIGRMTEQKGVDLLASLCGELAQLPLIFAFLGDGAGEISRQLEAADRKYGNIHYFRGYDERLAHRLYAAADFLVMPSRFEPCGLNQMIAMRYGTLPIVHKTGGLADTVHAIDNKEVACGRGIVIDKLTPEDLLKAIRSALALYQKRERLEALNRFNMACDFSFAGPAEAYLACYRALQRKKRG